MLSLRTKLLSILLVITFVSSSAFFALLPVTHAQVGGPDLNEGVSDTPGDAESTIGDEKDPTNIIEACGIKAAEDWLIDWAAGQVAALTDTTSVPSTDDALGASRVRASVKDCIKMIMNSLMKTAFTKFKKRLLDKLTDDVVGWISGATGKPKFIGNFNDVLRSTADAAIGDTIQALGAGKLCNNKLSLELQLNLARPTPERFSDNVSCTLSGVVKNVEAFGDNFKNGSWIGYQEVSSLQNNKYGLQLLAANELQAKSAKKVSATKVEIGGTNGFLSTKLCKMWSVIGQERLPDGSYGNPLVVGTFPSNNNDRYIDPNADLTIADIPNDSSYQPSLICGEIQCEPEWLECKAEDQVITTPGQTLANILGNSFQNDPNNLVNASDLTPYISKIFDAAFNRLIKEGVRGLSRASVALFSETSRGVTTPYPPGGGPGGGGVVSTSTVAQMRTNAKAALLVATTTLAEVSRTASDLSAKGTSLSVTLQALSSCQTTKLGRVCTSVQTNIAAVKIVTDKLDAANITLASIKTSLENDATKLTSQTLSVTDLALILSDIQTLTRSLESMKTSLANYASQLAVFDTTAFTAELNRCTNYTPGTTPIYACAP